MASAWRWPSSTTRRSCGSSGSCPRRRHPDPHRARPASEGTECIDPPPAGRFARTLTMVDAQEFRLNEILRRRKAKLERLGLDPAAADVSEAIVEGPAP